MAGIEWIQSVFGDGWLPFFLSVTYLGSEYAYIGLLTLFYWVVDPRVGRQLGLVLSVSYTFNQILKLAIALPRPFEVNPQVVSPVAKATIDSPSFPSGHAQGSATFWFYLAWHYRRMGLWGVSGAIVILVALSRVYLGVHYPLDAIAGVIFGMAIAWAGSRWWIPRRQGLLVPTLLCLGSFVLAVMVPDLGRPLGASVGFFLSVPHFTPPATGKGKVLFAGGGLFCVVALYIVSDWLLELLHSPGWMNFWRYCGLVLFATEVWPRVFPGKGNMRDSIQE